MAISLHHHLHLSLLLCWAVASSSMSNMGLTRVRRAFEFNIPGAKVGRVEVLWQGQWGTVCNQGFTQDDTKDVLKDKGEGRARTPQEPAFHLSTAAYPSVLRLCH
ncbi:hypothetical protein Pcinc_007555 [Petrolisthes cinctipes]|uniref:SRCR domain-containing protein n=1 Tax=Petrolisthes cinctipes TaxID=88211 RepID=A0AAE1KYG6_PETCI|nr:hypothetical protein Pcinc_007555 [Petrolisthes cinctipes]